jgi:hypothetical protein
MPILHDYCIVKVTGILLDKRPVGKDGNRVIFVNPFFDPQKYTEYTGVVVEVPKVLTDTPIVGKHVSLPSYSQHEDHVREGGWAKYYSDIHMDIRPGQKVYFHYNCLLPDDHEELYNRFYVSSEREMMAQPDGTLVPVVWHKFRVNYYHIYATVEYERTLPHMKPLHWFDEGKLKPTVLPGADADGHRQEPDALYVLGDNTYRKKVTMIGSWVFVEPDTETWDDIAMPTPETLNGKPVLDAKGKVKLKPKEEWIQIKSAPTNRYLQGWVRFLGKPLKGDDDITYVGAYVIFKPNTDARINFEGKEYFRMLQRNLLGEIPVRMLSA